MKINLRNIVSAALERGVIEGYLDSKNNPKIQEIPEGPQRDEAAVDALLDAIWANLDHFVDFDFDGDGPPSPTINGFAQTDAVSNTPVTHDADDAASDRIRIALRTRRARTRVHRGK